LNPLESDIRFGFDTSVDVVVVVVVVVMVVVVVVDEDDNGGFDCDGLYSSNVSTKFLIVIKTIYAKYRLSTYYR
jgi:hypothetical protein